jgi:hypothetical protein
MGLLMIGLKNSGIEMTEEREHNHRLKLPIILEQLIPFQKR